MLQVFRLGEGRVDLDRFVDRVLGSLSIAPTQFWAYDSPGRPVPIDLTVDEDNVIVRAEFPGMDSKDLKVEVSERMLKIEACVDGASVENPESYIVQERRMGDTTRVVRLPHRVDVDSVSSTYKNGVLEINLPKKDKAQVRQISIN